MKLTQEKLKELLDYDPEIGVFTRKIRTSNRIKIGSVTGSLDSHGYLRIRVIGNLYSAHRLAFLYMEGYLPENQVDHIDRNRANNKWNNLREVSRTCNMRNCNISKNNKSGVTGVNWCKETGKWRARIHMAKKIHLGCFDNLIDAAKARWNAEVKYGFPNCNTTSSAYMYLMKQGEV